MSKKYIQQAITILLATLILVVGKGYGSLTHTCEEHGRHSHLLINTEGQAHEHSGHHKRPVSSEEGISHHEHDLADFQFISIQAEPIAKTQPNFAFTWANVSPIGVLLPQVVLKAVTLVSSFSHTPPFLQRPYGRQLLAWVQSFLI